MTGSSALSDAQQLVWQAAMARRDPAYDGVFFICVKTTGIYCRPVCPAGPPKPRNMYFVATAAEAQNAGFRACKRCRPESAPQSAAWVGTRAVVDRARRAIDQGEMLGCTAESFAARFGLGARHLRRLFVQHLDITPADAFRQWRLSAARQLLAGTSVPITDISARSGYRSLRQFQNDFRARLGVSASDFRKDAQL